MENNYYQSLPKKRMGAGALFFDQQGRVLLLNPNYRDQWIIPGGIVEKNESPHKACLREIKEEIGLDAKNLGFLAVDYKKGTKEKGDALQFVFYGGILSPEQIGKIKLQSEEITEYKFVDPKNAVDLLILGIKSRWQACLEAVENNTAFYLENGQKV